VAREYIDPQYGYDSELVSFTLGPVPSADRGLAAAILDVALQPASVEVIQQALTALRVATKASHMQEGDLTLTMQVYADECAEYPPDVVRAACLRWMRREKWFPSLSELRDEMQRLVRRRRLIADALR